MDLNDLESRLWATAGLKPSEFSTQGLGLIFLRYAERRFHEVESNQGFITCRPSAAFQLWVLFHWVKANVETFISLGTGATVKEITKGTFKGIKLTAPPAAVNVKHLVQSGG